MARFTFQTKHAFLDQRMCLIYQPEFTNQPTGEGQEDLSKLQRDCQPHNGQLHMRPLQGLWGGSAQLSHRAG